MANIKENNLNLGKRIREAREKLHKNQAEFAAMIDVLPAHLNRWEKGRIAPGWFFLVRIAKTCGVTLDWLLTGKENENTKNGNKGFSKKHITDEEIFEINEWMVSHPNDKKHIYQLIVGKKMIENAFENLRNSENEKMV